MVSFPTTLTGVLQIVLFGGAGLLMVGYAIREAGAIRILLSSKSTDVFSLTRGTTGPVSVSGTATRYENVLESPFTGTECVVFDYEVLEYDPRSDDEYGSNWSHIDSGHAAVPFLLEDETGTVLVDTADVQLGLDTSEEIYVDGGDHPPAPIQQLIESTPDVGSEKDVLDVGIFELKTGDDRRYIERRLDVGEAVTVFGTAVDKPGISTRSGQVNSVIEAGSYPLVISETTPYRTIFRVFWYVFLVGGLGIAFLYIAIEPLFI